MGHTVESFPQLALFRFDRFNANFEPAAGRLGVAPQRLQGDIFPDSMRATRGWLTPMALATSAWVIFACVRASIIASMRANSSPSASYSFRNSGSAIIRSRTLLKGTVAYHSTSLSRFKAISISMRGVFCVFLMNERRIRRRRPDAAT
jgi:hypothetical protein